MQPPSPSGFDGGELTHDGLVPPPFAADRILPSSASTSEPGLFPQPYGIASSHFIPPSNFHSPLQSIVTPSPFTTAQAPVPVPVVPFTPSANGSTTFGVSSDSIRSSSDSVRSRHPYPPYYTPLAPGTPPTSSSGSIHHQNVTTRRGGIQDSSISIPTSIKNQVQSMHQQFDINQAALRSSSTASSAGYTVFHLPLTANDNDNDNDINDDGSIESIAAPSFRAHSNHINSDVSLFLTDEEIKHDRDRDYDRSPISISNGERLINASYEGFSTYGLEFKQSDSGLQIADCEFGTDLSLKMRLDCEDVNNGCHRYVIICRCKRTNKIFGLDICPSKSITIRSFPLLLVVRDNHNIVIGHVANPLLRGSISSDPTLMKSHHPFYMSASGWNGGGVFNSYGLAKTIIDGYRRLTGNASGVIHSVDVASYDIAIASCVGTPIIIAPRIRSYILSQLHRFGINNFSVNDLMSCETALSPATPLGYADPVLAPWPSSVPSSFNYNASKDTNPSNSSSSHTPTANRAAAAAAVAQAAATQVAASQAQAMANLTARLATANATIQTQAAAAAVPSSVPSSAPSPAPAPVAPSASGLRASTGAGSLETIPQEDLDAETNWHTVTHRPSIRQSASYAAATAGLDTQVRSFLTPTAGGPSVIVTNSLVHACIATADRPIVARLGKINVTCYLSNTSSSFIPNILQRVACLDSGASHDLWNNRTDFISYKDLTGLGKYVSLADDSKIPIMGIGTIKFRLAGKIICFRNVYHVPRLEIPLIALRVHRRRAQGCAFVSDFSGCFFTFPNFSIEVDDDVDVTVPISSCSADLPPDYSDASKSTRHARRCNAMAKRTAYLEAAITARRTSQPFLPSPVYHSHSKHSSNDSSSFHPSSSSDEFPPLPNRFVPDSASSSTQKLSYPQLHQLFGCRKLDYSILPHLGIGLEVPLSEAPPLSIGDVVNIKRGKRGGKIQKIAHANHTIGADIGYGDGTSPGGYKYCLFLTCLSTKQCFIYGLRDLKGATIAEAFWMFAIDAGGFPKRLRCDFDKRFIQGDVARLLRSHGVRIGASPPHRQSQNGAVERQWQTACNMGRSLLITATLPKRYWFWALREAVSRMCMLPVKSGPCDDDLGEFTPFNNNDDSSISASRTYLSFNRDSNITGNLAGAAPPPPLDASHVTTIKPRRRTKFQQYQDKAEHLSTSHELFYGKKPDYRVIFPFGCIGYFRKPFLSSGQKTSNFHSKTAPGIALGRSDFSNAMVFYDPTTSCFSTSADYKLDLERELPDAFPGLVFDGAFTSKRISKAAIPKEAFPPGSHVFARINDEFFEGSVIGVPTTAIPWYIVSPIAGGDPFNVDPMEISAPDDPMYPLDTYRDDLLSTPLPSWIKNNSKITLSVDNYSRPGYLALTDDLLWEFIQRDGRGSISFRFPLHDLPTSWRSRLLQGSLDEGWPSSFSPVPAPIARKVCAKGLQEGVPASFKRSMNKSHPDYAFWKLSYCEEYESLQNQHTYEKITKKSYWDNFSHISIIPTMCVQTIKHDEHGDPDRTKSRIVALGNFEDDIWSKSDRYAPVISKTNHRLLTTIAVDMGRKQKQGDCKNAFLHPDLPENETIICRPPHGCPLSKIDELWLLKKTIYGLRRSPHHWFKYISEAFLRLGLKPLPNEPCIFTGTLIKGEPPIYVGLYVDDFTYFSASDAVENAFEDRLGSDIEVEFMGDVTWFLGCLYTWQTLPDGRLTVHISQTAKIESMLEEFDLLDANPVNNIYRSGFAIDRIRPDGIDPSEKRPLVKSYQRLVGGLNWLSLCTRPEITTAVRLLSRRTKNPTTQHLDSAKRVLQWLGGTRTHGIRFTQGEAFAKGIVAWVDRPADVTSTTTYTDANWGPQDASTALPGQTITDDECRSLLGHIVIRMGGPVAWDCMREPKSSRSVCQAEILSMDEGCKSTLQVRNISIDLSLPEVLKPTPLFNDNRGAVDWSSGCNISKRLRHFNIREIAVRDDVKSGDIIISHLPGKVNIADIFTKEITCDDHFKTLSFQLISPRDLS